MFYVTATLDTREIYQVIIITNRAKHWACSDSFSLRITKVIDKKIFFSITVSSKMPYGIYGGELVKGATPRVSIILQEVLY